MDWVSIPKDKDLTSMMDNVFASRLGRVSRTFKDEHYADSIDAGLVLRQRLEEAGFALQYRREPLDPPPEGQEK